MPLHRPLSCIVALAVPFAAPVAHAQEAALGTFEDVPLDHWAFLTVELLVRKYKVMAGFPDASFKGEQTVTRNELAAAVERVMARMELLRSVGQPISPADISGLKNAITALDLPAVKARILALEEATAPLEKSGVRTVTITGGSGTTWMDNTQDDVRPFLTTGFGIDLKAKVADAFDVLGSLGGGLAASTVGNKPATAGSDKPPGGFWNFGQVHVTSQIAGVQVRSGLFEPGNFYGAGTSLANKWGGIIGNGFIGPDRNTVRWYDKSVALAATREFGGLKVTAGVTPLVFLAGIDYKIADFLRVKLAADTDQPDWWQVNPNRAVARNIYGVLDLGTDRLGLSLQGGLAKNLTQASAQVTWSPLWDMRLGVGAVYKTSEKAVTEVTPGLSIFVPSLTPLAPSLLFGIKEPQIISASSGNTGPGSLLGEQAGATLLAEWILEDRGFPNVKVEYNIQQPVLFYSIYDATFAVDIGRGF